MVEQFIVFISIKPFSVKSVITHNSYLFGDAKIHGHMDHLHNHFNAMNEELSLSSIHNYDFHLTYDSSRESIESDVNQFSQDPNFANLYNFLKAFYVAQKYRENFAIVPNEDVAVNICEPVPVNSNEPVLENKYQGSPPLEDGNDSGSDDDSSSQISYSTTPDKGDLKACSSSICKPLDDFLFQ